MTASGKKWDLNKLSPMMSVLQAHTSIPRTPAHGRGEEAEEVENRGKGGSEG